MGPKILEVANRPINVRVGRDTVPVNALVLINAILYLAYIDPNSEELKLTNLVKLGELRPDRVEIERALETIA